MISIIVAIAQNNVIGGNNTLLWHISEDLKHFKSITSGHPVVMGRKTYESLGRPLPNRRNVVITRSDMTIEGCEVVHSLSEALDLFNPKDKVFIIGGAQIYHEALPLADRFYLTRVEHDYEGDTLFPEWDESEWECISRERNEHGAKYEYPFVFEEYRRVASSKNEEYHIAQAAREDAAMINKIAQGSFYNTYKDIVPADQIEWMFEDMYSIKNIQERQFDEGQQFFILYHRGEGVGYVSLEPVEEGLIHLQKLYLLPEAQGHGYGRKLIEYAFARAKEMCNGDECRLELDVNRNNRAVDFYFKIGLKVAKEINTVIEGTNYIRPDYLLYIDL